MEYAIVAMEIIRNLELGPVKFGRVALVGSGPAVARLPTTPDLPPGSRNLALTCGNMCNMCQLIMFDHFYSFCGGDVTFFSSIQVGEELPEAALRSVIWITCMCAPSPSSATARNGTSLSEMIQLMFLPLRIG